MHASPTLLGVLVLPPLLGAAAADVAPAELRAVGRAVTGLAVGLVVLSAAAVAGLVHVLLPGLGVGAALVTGAALGSTDPVAVVALSRRVALPPRLLALVHSESLLNDATSLLLFGVLTAAAAAGQFSAPQHPGTGLRPGGLLGSLALLAGLGVAVGAAGAVGLGVLRRAVRHGTAQALLTVLAPYPVYVAALAVHGSAVTAVVVSGLLGGAHRHATGPGPAPAPWVPRLSAAAVLGLEAAVFAGMGVQLPGLLRAVGVGGGGAALRATVAAVAGAALLLVLRLGWCAAAASLPAPSWADGPAGSRRRTAVVAAWAGTRGLLPLVAVLSLPTHRSGGGALPGRELVIVVVSLCTVVTVVAQGSTLPWVVRRCGAAAAALPPGG